MEKPPEPDRLWKLLQRTSLALILVTFAGIAVLPVVVTRFFEPGSAGERASLVVYLLLPVSAFLLALLACQRRGKTDEVAEPDAITESTHGDTGL
jgi:hypothetical protein